MKKSIRDIKKGLQNFARNEDEGLSKKELLYRKCAIINTHLYKGGCFRHKGWEGRADKTPRELIQFLEGIEAGYADNNVVVELCSHLINVLEYLMDDRGVVKPPKYGLAVRKPTEALHALINHEERAREENEDFNGEPLQQRLMEAIRCGDVDEVKSLVELGVSKYILYGSRSQPLIKAAECFREKEGVEIIRYLLSNGANVNAIGENYYTPLKTALAYDHPEAARVLLAAGAEVMLPDEWEENHCPTILIAVKNIREEEAASIIKALVAAGADVNALSGETRDRWTDKVSYNNSALTLAIKRKDKSEDNTLSIVKALVEAGVDTNFVDKNGRTALDIAIYENKPAIAEYLQTLDGAGSLRKIAPDQFEEFEAKCLANIDNGHRATDVVNYISQKPDFIEVEFGKNVAQYRVEEALRKMVRFFNDMFGYKPKYIMDKSDKSYDQKRFARIYTI